MEIDIADFSCHDIDEPETSVPQGALYNKSYQAFLQSALNINPKIEKPELPEPSEGHTYAEWYFRVINPYCPVLHKGTFMSLVSDQRTITKERLTSSSSIVYIMIETSILHLHKL
jgi:hypothetical protein